MIVRAHVFAVLALGASFALLVREPMLVLVGALGVVCWVLSE